MARHKYLNFSFLEWIFVAFVTTPRYPCSINHSLSLCVILSSEETSVTCSVPIATAAVNLRAVPFLPKVVIAVCGAEFHVVVPAKWITQTPAVTCTCTSRRHSVPQYAYYSHSSHLIFSARTSCLHPLLGKCPTRPISSHYSNPWDTLELCALETPWVGASFRDLKQWSVTLVSFRFYELRVCDSPSQKLACGSPNPAL